MANHPGILDSAQPYHAPDTVHVGDGTKLPILVTNSFLSSSKSCFSCSQLKQNLLSVALRNRIPILFIYMRVVFEGSTKTLLRCTNPVPPFDLPLIVISIYFCLHESLSIIVASSPGSLAHKELDRTGTLIITVKTFYRQKKHILLVYATSARLSSPASPRDTAQPTAPSLHPIQGSRSPRPDIMTILWKIKSLIVDFS